MVGRGEIPLPTGEPRPGQGPGETQVGEAKAPGEDRAALRDAARASLQRREAGAGGATPGSIAKEAQEEIQAGVEGSAGAQAVEPSPAVGEEQPLVEGPLAPRSTFADLLASARGVQAAMQKPEFARSAEERLLIDRNPDIVATLEAGEGGPASPALGGPVEPKQGGEVEEPAAEPLEGGAEPSAAVSVEQTIQDARDRVASGEWAPTDAARALQRAKVDAVIRGDSTEALDVSISELSGGQAPAEPAATVGGEAGPSGPPDELVTGVEESAATGGGEAPPIVAELPDVGQLSEQMREAAQTAEPGSVEAHVRDALSIPGFLRDAEAVAVLERNPELVRQIQSGAAAEPAPAPAAEAPPREEPVGGGAGPAAAELPDMEELSEQMREAARTGDFDSVRETARSLGGQSKEAGELAGRALAHAILDLTALTDEQRKQLIDQVGTAIVEGGDAARQAAERETVGGQPGGGEPADDGGVEAQVGLPDAVAAAEEKVPEEPVVEPSEFEADETRKAEIVEGLRQKIQWGIEDLQKFAQSEGTEKVSLRDVTEQELISAGTDLVSMGEEERGKAIADALFYKRINSGIALVEARISPDDPLLTGLESVLSAEDFQEIKKSLFFTQLSSEINKNHPEFLIDGEYKDLPSEREWLNTWKKYFHEHPELGVEAELPEEEEKVEKRPNRMIEAIRKLGGALKRPFGRRGEAEEEKEELQKAKRAGALSVVGGALRQAAERYINNFDPRDKNLKTWLGGITAGAVTTIGVAEFGATLGVAPVVRGIAVATWLNSAKMLYELEHRRRVRGAVGEFVKGSNFLIDPARKREYYDKVIGLEKDLAKQKLRGEKFQVEYQSRLEAMTNEYLNPDLDNNIMKMDYEALQKELLKVGRQYADVSSVVRSLSSGLAVGSLFGALGETGVRVISGNQWHTIGDTIGEMLERPQVVHPRSGIPQGGLEGAPPQPGSPPAGGAPGVPGPSPEAPPSPGGAAGPLGPEGAVPGPGGAGVPPPGGGPEGSPPGGAGVPGPRGVPGPEGGAGTPPPPPGGLTPEARQAYDAIASTAEYATQKAAEVGKELPVIDTILEKALKEKGVALADLDPSSLEKARLAVQHAMEAQANTSFDGSLDALTKVNPKVDINSVVGAGQKSFEQWIATDEAQTKLTEIARKAMTEQLQSQVELLGKVTAGLEADPSLFTDHLINRGMTAGSMFRDAGYSVSWTGKDGPLFAAHIAANYDMLSGMWHQMAQAHVIPNTEFPVSLSELNNLAARAEAGDEESFRKLVRALHWIPAGSKMRILTRAGISKTLEMVK